MRPGDLTTLGNLKTWLATSGYTQRSDDGNTDINRTYQQAISRISQDILAYLLRRWILPREFINDQYSGNGGDTQFLRYWPVLSISGLNINGMAVPQSTLPGPGYGYLQSTWDGIPPKRPGSINVTGTRFYGGKTNILVTYRAGYQVTDEPQVIPTPEGASLTSQLIVDQPYGIWALNVSVVRDDVDRTPLVLVTTAPAATNEYRVIPPDEGSPLSLPGVYEFFGADAGVPILITYGFIPGALEQAAISLISERLQQRQRVGEISRTVQQQVTVRYDMSAIPEYIRFDLQPYKSVLML